MSTEIPSNEQRFTVRTVKGEAKYRIYDELYGAFASGRFYDQGFAEDAARRENLKASNRAAMQKGAR